MPENCRDFFETNKGNKEICKLLQQVPLETHLRWEGESASTYSPGPVVDDELLCRQVLDPNHFDQATGQIKPNFFEDASDKGASCHRLQHVSVADVERMARARVELVNQNPPGTGRRTAIGYATIAASVVRSITVEVQATPPERRRGVGVYDTAKQDDNSHADVCQLVSGKQAGKSVRAQLFKLAKETLVRFSSD